MILPPGFLAGSATAGLKASGKPDVALIVTTAENPVAAGVTTTNRVVAHPVIWTRRALEDGHLKAVLLNSGNANVATKNGWDATERSAMKVAELIGCGPAEVAVCSTGVIGVELDYGLLDTGIESAAGALSSDGGDGAARAIMTTDTVEKTATHTSSFTVSGMAKGSGMIAPGLATMLCVIMTDADVEASVCREVLQAAVEETFNRIDVDGCMSTNDTVLLLSSRMGPKVSADELGAAVTDVCRELARAMIGDAEGASHDVLINVTSASSVEAGLAVARAIARSNLVKCAIFGGDPNWGRIISAAGTVPEEVAPFDPARLMVEINGTVVCRDGLDAGGREDVDLSEREVRITVDLGAGDSSAQVWTNDLTHDYVHENSAYTT